MKIISKYKDYYDYLQGIYGVDEKLVLDRRSDQFVSGLHWSMVPDKWDQKEMFAITMAICDYIINGVFKEGQFYWGDDLLKIGIQEKRKGTDVYRRDDYNADEWVQVEMPSDSWRGNIRIINKANICKVPRKHSDSKNNPNEILKCPILLSNTNKEVLHTGKPYDANDHWIKYPILQDYGVQKMFPPEEIYKMLSDWLSRHKEESVVDNQSNIEKIQSHGFDKRRSFRPKMK